MRQTGHSRPRGAERHAPGKGFGGGGSSRRTPRSSAERCLLDTLVSLAGRDGYGELTVEALLCEAGVSRGTFYQYFTSLDDCFRDAYRQLSERLVREVTEAIGRGEGGEQAMLKAALALALDDPDAMRVLCIEGLAAGTIGLAGREALIASLESVLGRAPRRASVVDLPAPVLAGCLLRFFAMRLIRVDAAALTYAEVWEWVNAFSRHRSEPSFSARLTPVPSPALGGSMRVAARPVGAGGIPSDGGSPRERLIAATAAVVSAEGYARTTVASIVARAGVSRGAFYKEFANRREAYMAACQHALDGALRACVPAFFSSRSWPQRVQASALAFAGFFAQEPDLAHLGFVDCYALGRGFVARAHETQLTFTMFLEDGYRQDTAAPRISRACSELTAAAMMELGFRVSRNGAEEHAVRLVPLATYVVLTPFVGTRAAADTAAQTTPQALHYRTNRKP